MRGGPVYGAGMSSGGCGGADISLDMAQRGLEVVKAVEVEEEGADAVAEPWEEGWNSPA